MAGKPFGKDHPGKPFSPGVSGNPGGPPKGVLRQLREKHGDDVMVVFENLVKIAKGEQVPGFLDVAPKERIKCAELVTDRLWGKPKQEIESTVRDAHLDQLVEALKLTPHERRMRLAAIEAEDNAALAEGTDGADDPDA